MEEHKQQAYEEWAKKIREASGIVDGSTYHVEDKPHQDESGEPEAESKDNNKYLFITICIILFLISFIPRLIFIFFIGNPDNPGAGWFGDAYHHWQIAYLTQTVGLNHGFLRLWDLKGLEFFWGLLHPLIMMIFFTITGNHSIGLERTVTAFFGSISTVLIFLIVRRFWNTKAALAAAIFTALNPVGVFNDGSGMVEPLGIPFLLLGVYLWPKRPFLTGLALFIALTARSEYWVFSLGLVLAMAIFTKTVSDKKMLLFFGFFAPLVLYMKYLLDWTTNPIYPLYQNYLSNVFGTWQFKQVLEPADIMGKNISLLIFVITAIMSVIVIRKRPNGMFFYLLGLGNWLFIGATFGFTAYIKSYATYVWYVRFMILPYIFLGAVLAIFLFYYLPKKKYFGLLDKIQLTWVFFISVLILSQLVWVPIWNKYSTTQKTWQQTLFIADQVALNYNGGGLLLFEGNPEITYALVQFHNVKGKNIVSGMFDPYFYFTSDPYEDWPKYRKKVLGWIRQNNIKTIATYSQYKRYSALVKKEPQFFSNGIFLLGTNIVMYEVKDALYKQDF